MKKDDLPLVIMILSVVSLLFISVAVTKYLGYQANHDPLTEDVSPGDPAPDLEAILGMTYPDFLIEVDADVLDTRISEFQTKANYTGWDMIYLWKLLWMKKEFYPHEYISEDQRSGFADKIARAHISNLDVKYVQVNTLKYKLGINNISELQDYSGEKYPVCDDDNLFLEQVNWTKASESGFYFDIVHFCGLDFTKQDVERLLTAIESEDDPKTRGHALEHGVNDVPVYINDCSMAKTENERYHCLFFN